MAYRLGVDLGTTFTAAAVDDGTGPTMLGLGNRALSVPSVVFLTPDGQFLFGETADRRASGDAARAAREFKRRIGDTIPIMVGGQPFAPQALSARLLAWVVSVATERQGAAPAQVVVTHPANWGGYKLELLQQLIDLADVPDAETCTEPEAAATQYAAHAALRAGDKVAVYDLGGGTFDVCVLERQDDGFAILGSPYGVEHLGGIDFDEAIFQHVLGLLAGRTADLDVDDERVLHGLGRLRRECVEAKEALSSDVDTSISVELPGISTSLRLTRLELEGLIATPLHDTLDATARALRSAGLQPTDLATVVLVGGSSRIPLVNHLLQQEFGVRTAMDTHPKHDIALGAVRYRAAAPAAPAAADPPATAWPTRGIRPSPEASPPSPVGSEPATAGGPPARHLHDDRGADDRPTTSTRPWSSLMVAVTGRFSRLREPRLAAAAAILAVVAIAGLVAGIAALAGPDDPRDSSSSETSESTSPTSTSASTPTADTVLSRSSVIVPMRTRRGDDIDLFVIDRDEADKQLAYAGIQRFPSVSQDRRLLHFATLGTNGEWKHRLLTSTGSEPMVDHQPRNLVCRGNLAWPADLPGRVAMLCGRGVIPSIEPTPSNEPTPTT